MARTTNYSFDNPTVGGSEGTWGASLVENWSKLDALLNGASFTDAGANTVERISPDLEPGLWTIGGVAVTATAAQINTVATDAGLTSIAGLTTAADRMVYATASDVFAVTPLTAAARTLLDDTSVSAMRITLGIGSGFVAAGTEVTDFNDVAASGLYWGGAAATNMPGTANVHTLLHIYVNSNISTQQATDVSTGTVYNRVRSSGVWGAWS